jgi:NMD protein affecting ribosome stability and mRNA decay
VAEDEPKRCRLCGQPIEPEYEDIGLCGDCYWDDQTNADDTVGDE